MNKLLPFLVFSILLLVPIGSQQVFANHPQLACPPPGVLNQDANLWLLSSVILPFNINNPPGISNFCYTNLSSLTVSILNCPPGYVVDGIADTTSPAVLPACVLSPPQSTPDPTHPDQCQGASILVNNHCFAQALNNIIGGELLVINTIPLLVGAIGVNPIITGLVGITLAGVVGQTVWFVHRRKKNSS